MKREEIEKVIHLIVVPDLINGSIDDRDIIENSETLLEIAKVPDSEFSSLIIEVAKAKNIDMKYLSDGANYLLSKLHFSDNYYKVLCLFPDAIPSEIKKRWRELMHLYHPDRYGEKDEWVTERAKRVNEAYSILKDDKKRKEYDERLLKESQFTVHSSQSTVHSSLNGDLKRWHKKKHVVSGANLKVTPKEFFIFGRPFSELRRKIPLYITVSYIVASLLFLLLIFLKYYPIDSGPKNTVELESKPPIEETERPFIPIFPDLEHSKQTDLKTEKEIPPSPMETEKDIVIDSTLRKEKMGVTNNQAPLIKPKTQIPMKTELPTPETEIPLDPLAKKTTSFHTQVPHAQSDREDPEKLKTLKPSGMNMMVHTSVKEVASTKSEGSIKVSNPTADEARAFIRDYISIYEKGDIDQFMALFSRSAIENGFIDYNGIRNIYVRTFERGESKYKIETIEIKPMEDHTLVSGIYNIEQIQRIGKKIKVSGKIRWRLMKEEGEIRILRSDYREL